MYGTYCRLNVHVHASTKDVLRALRRKLKPSVRKGRKHRDARHAIARAILKEHANARALFDHFRF